MRSPKPTIVVNADGLAGREPPQAVESERQVLGAMILDHRCIDEIEQVLRPDAFFSDLHKALYAAILRVRDRQSQVDVVMLAAAMRGSEFMADAEWGPFLLDLARETSGPVPALPHARIIRDKHRLRALADAGMKVAYLSHTCGVDGDVDDVVDECEQVLYAATDSRSETRTSTIAELLEHEFARLRSPKEVGVFSNFPDLDEMTGGFQPGDLIIIAGRPSMGKTAFGLSIMLERMLRGGRPGLFSLEMSKDAIAQRLIGMQSGVATKWLRSGKASNADYAKAEAAITELAATEMLVDDTPAISIGGLRSRARRMKSSGKIDMLVVDYLQLMSDPTRSGENRQVEVASISRGLKAIARELGIPVLALSQLNRGPEARTDNRPRLSDLRESGAIEQDADVVCLLHREAYYHLGDAEWLADNPDAANTAECIIAKQRNGPTGVVRFTWRATASRFLSYHEPVAFPAGSPGQPLTDANDPFSGPATGRLPYMTHGQE